MDRSSRKKINKETQALNNTLDQMDLTDIYRAFHPKAVEYTFFSSAHRPFLRIDHMLGHKTSLSKFKKIEVISSIFSKHNSLRLEINYKKETAKKHKHVGLNNTLLNNKWITDKIKEEIKKYLEKNENKNMIIQNLWDTAKAVLR